MDIRWILYGHIPKIGMEKYFRELQDSYVKTTLDASVTPKRLELMEPVYRETLKKISKTPQDFDQKFKRIDGIIDAKRIHESVFISQTLRARALSEQTAIEAIDYGHKLMCAALLINPQGSIQVVNEVKFLQRTATWLQTWGKRGFGYFVLR